MIDRAAFAVFFSSLALNLAQAEKITLLCEVASRVDADRARAGRLLREAGFVEAGDGEWDLRGVNEASDGG